MVVASTASSSPNIPLYGSDKLVREAAASAAARTPAAGGLPEPLHYIRDQSGQSVSQCLGEWCQPHILLVTLTVTEARASILGSKEKVFRAGSSMQLVCTVKHLSQQPAFVFW